MASELYFRPVVETRATQRAIIHAEAGDTNDVQRRVSRRTQARDVAGVRWNLGFDQCDAEHAGPISRKAKRNDELRLKVSSFLSQGPFGLRCLCAPVEGSCCNLLVRVISSLRLSWCPSWLRPSWLRPSSRPSFHLF